MWWSQENIFDQEGNMDSCFCVLHSASYRKNQWIKRLRMESRAHSCLFVTNSRTCKPGTPSLFHPAKPNETQSGIFWNYEKMLSFSYHLKLQMRINSVGIPQKINRKGEWIFPWKIMSELAGFVVIIIFKKILPLKF